ncbi:shikimate kinase AroL [Desulfohalovibrio reitneri]|uniref:shikimate kinase AroL n=1 Tax=Desulfohalovibrio reitneri TaxID=1307759 RepID=UPI0004A73826|nr:shikimate kinase AroL [Desulfohalovibrio reitneri]
MARNVRPKDAVMKKHSVRDENLTMVYSASGRATNPNLEAAPPKNVFLVGLRGSGKSTIARLAAENLGKTFVDTDARVVEKAGRPIAEIVAEQGWDAFRQIEHDTLAEICSDSGQIVATGGGIVLREDNRGLLRQNGRTYYLLADLKTLADRLEAHPQSDQRPPLTELAPEEELRQTLNEREPLYYQVIDGILQASRTPEEIVEDLKEKLRL